MKTPIEKLSFAIGSLRALADSGKFGPEATARLWEAVQLADRARAHAVMDERKDVRPVGGTFTHDGRDRK